MITTTPPPTAELDASTLERYESVLKSYAVDSCRDSIDSGMGNIAERLLAQLSFQTPSQRNFDHRVLEFLKQASDYVAFGKQSSRAQINTGVAERDLLLGLEAALTKHKMPTDVVESNARDVLTMLRVTDFIQYQGPVRVYSLRAILIEDDLCPKNDPKHQDKYILLKKPLYVNAPILRNIMN
jgi:hypothetical protein